MATGRKVTYNYSGIMPAAFTPLNDDNTINCSVIPSYAQYLVNNGFESVLVGGTTGEHMCLNVNDRKKVIDAWVDASRSTGLHVQAQVGGGPFADTIELAKYCSTNGVHSILTLPELYFRPETVDDLVSYIEMIAKAAPNLPVIYYHNPSRSNVTLNMSEFVKAASESIPNFKGLKSASVDLIECAHVLKAIKDDKVFFYSHEQLFAPAALLGMTTTMFSCASLFPKVYHDVLASIENKDYSKAAEMQKKLSASVTALLEEGEWISVMKYGMELLTGIKVGPPSLPKKALSSEVKKKIEQKLVKMGYIIL